MKRMNQTKKSNIKYNLTIFTKNTYFDIIDLSYSQKWKNNLSKDKKIYISLLID